ncbi:MAG TPA: Smr/MutS family protein [Acidobacteriota bacterium]|nr:Smr/MutS family protein [Acidobacteriota bacterium]
MDAESVHLLEIEQVLDIVARFAHTPAGQKRILQTVPLGRLEELQHRLQLVVEALQYYKERGRPGFRHLPDCRPILETLQRSGDLLEGVELRELLELLKAGEHLTSLLQEGDWNRLREITDTLVVPFAFMEELERSLDPAGGVREEAYPELREARRQQDKIRSRLQEQLGRFLKGQKARYLIPEPFITQRAERYVLPVLVQHQNEIPGITHDVSSSGGTVFVEPLASVPLNNELLYHRQRELEILRKVLTSLTDQARDNLEGLTQVEEIVTFFDEVFSICEFAQRFSYVVPKLSQSTGLALEEARHPLLIDSMGQHAVVPVSFQLSPEENVLVISGPNTGGKTVALKTVGLLSLMAHFGLPIPAQTARIPFFSDILVDMGDRQSIQSHLSTFSGHIVRMNEILQNADEHSLVILDEVGRGTDPTHGAALAIAIVEELKSRQALVMVSTHHQAMKSYAASAPGVRNASVLLDPETLTPTYRIKVGIAGESSGFEMARQMGFPESLLEKAFQALAPEQREIERFLEELRLEKLRVEQERSVLQEMQAELEREKANLLREFERENRCRNQEFEERIQKWESEFHREVKEYVKRLKDRFEAARLRQETGRKVERLKESFRRQFKAEQEGKESISEPAGQGELQEGDTVYHKFFRQKGVVISVGSQEAIIEMNGKRVTALPAQLQKVESRQVIRRPSKQITLHVVEETDSELNLVGERVDEAMALLDKFLDRAFVAQLPEIRIVHGFGTGRLKSAVGELLSQHPHVKSFRLEGGATVAILTTQEGGV